MITNQHLKNFFISLFVVLWLCVFHYESTRAFWLEPLLHRPLPKVKFLFPPAGWIMFFNVDDQYGQTEVYGVKDGRPQLIDPHLILTTRPIGYDNIDRNALSAVLSREMVNPFCRYLSRKFPYFEKFLIVYVQYPSLSKASFERRQQVLYSCP